jgi:DNA ligase-1
MSNVLLAKAWSSDVDPTGWWMSEKLDGVRALWNGREFVSRLGNTFAAPEFFTAQLPDVTLDGELWMGRGEFQRTVSVVKSRADKGWTGVRYRVFDAPTSAGAFEARHDEVQRLVRVPVGGGFAEPVVQLRCEGYAHLMKCLTTVLEAGGEGVMLRKPGSAYEHKRSSTLLKVKVMHDLEATVLGHEPGKGRHVGRLGALRCRLPSGVEFACGSGFSDAQREAPPDVGAQVTVRYQELTRDGVPRFPVFVCVRDYEGGAS